MTLTRPEPGTPEHWARTRPTAVAVIDGDDELTYGQWNDMADRVAEGLAQHGLGAGDRLGMRFRLGIEWFVIQRALQKLEVAHVAVNWRLTPDEAIYILRDSQAKGLACNDSEAESWYGHDTGLLITVGQPAGTPGLRYEDLLETRSAEPRFGPLRPSLVLYTSGTTGRPRGVPPLDMAQITDVDRLMRYAASVSAVPPTAAGAVALLTLPIHHGAGPAAATSACANGGTVVLLDPFDAETALQLIERHAVQVWTSVPTMLLRIQALPKAVLEKYDLSSLRALSTGAAPVPQSLKEWITRRLGDDVLWEAYGASEVGMITYLSPEAQLTKPGTSGLPYDGVEIAIVDEDWNRLPVGQTGEIAVNTPMGFRRYLGGNDLGAEVIHDGFYRTGDLGHLDEGGYLYITDRVKDMIVAGGVNIYPAEIEKALVAHPGVIDAAVIGIPHDDFGEQPMAFIVADPDSRPSPDDLLSFLDGQLASYKKPRRFTFVDELPLNPSGKVLKNELREPFWRGHDRNV